ncbi:DUF11 domain-containing protein [Candidatus Woesearchaeota archaeon]|nr:DUF11 domain-containing protein [Candidatus Woesearchaeota archaeon]
MKLRGVVVLLFLIISSSNVLGFDNLFDDYVYTLDTFQVEDDIYYVGLANGEEVLILHKNEFEVFYVYNGTCEDTAYYQYCFMGTKLDYNDYGRPIPNTLIWEPAIKVQIFSKKPSVSITRSVDSEINRDGKALVTITIKNNGELVINNLEFEEIIPGTAFISVLPEGLTAQNNVITWTRPILTAGDSRSFIYNIKPNSYDSIKLENGTLTYEYEDSEFTEDSSSSTISINSPVSVSSSMSESEVGLEELFTYTLTVTNDDWDDAMSVDFNFVIPEEVTVEEVSSDLSKSRNIEHDFNLQPGESETFFVTMKSGFEGVHEFSPQIIMNIRDEVFTDDKKLNVTINLPKPTFELSLSRTEVFEGSPFTITATMTNPAEVSFYDMSGIVESTMFETRSANLVSIAPSETKKVFEEQIKGLSVDEDEIFDITFRGRYRSHNFQFFDFQDNASIKIKSVTVGFDISKSLSKTEVVPREEVTVTVGAKNLGQKISVIELKEELPSDFEVISGLTEKTLTMGVGADEEFYIYKVRISVDTEPGTYSLKTHLNYEGIVNQTEEATLRVKANLTGKTPDVSIDTGSDKEKEEKKGFFGKIIDFFIGLFK